MSKAKAAASVLAVITSCVAGSLYIGLSAADNAKKDTIGSMPEIRSLSNVATVTYTEPTYETIVPKAIYLFGEYTVACAPDFFESSVDNEEEAEEIVEETVVEETAEAEVQEETPTEPETTEPASEYVVAEEVVTEPATEAPVVIEPVTEAPVVEVIVEEAPVEEEVDTYVSDVIEEYAEPVSEDTDSGYSIPITDEEYIILCNAVAHEAGSSWIDVYSKAYVAEVIMNRVYSELFPGSIYDVLTAPYQFTGAENYVNLGYFSNEVTESVKEAVLLYFTEPQSFTQGYLYFYGDGYQNHFN